MTTETRSALRAVRRLGLWWVVGVIAGAGLLVVGARQVAGVTFCHGLCCRGAVAGDPPSGAGRWAGSSSALGRRRLLARSGCHCGGRLRPRSPLTRLARRAAGFAVPRGAPSARGPVSARARELAARTDQREGSDWPTSGHCGPARTRCGSDAGSWIACEAAHQPGTTDAVEPATT
jgi:hypothetical protein